MNVGDVGSDLFFNKLDNLIDVDELRIFVASMLEFDFAVGEIFFTNRNAVRHANQIIVFEFNARANVTVIIEDFDASFLECILNFFGRIENRLATQLKRRKDDVIRRDCGRQIIWTLHDCWSFTGHCAYFDFARCDKWKTGCHHCPQHKEYPKSYVDNSKFIYSRKQKWFTGVQDLTTVTPSNWLAGLVGESFLKDYPDITRRIFEEGHEIGLHGYSHKNMAAMSRHAVAKELSDTLSLLPQGYRPTFFRPPGGAFSESITRNSLCA